MLADLPHVSVPVYALICSAVICLAAGGAFGIGVLTWLNRPSLLESEKAAADAARGVEHATLLNASLAESMALRCTQQPARMALLDFAATLRDNSHRVTRL